MTILISQDGVKISANRLRLIKKKAEKILRALGCEETELSILLTEKKRIKELNICYRNEKRTPEVLAFPQGRGPKKEMNVLGDVVLRADNRKIKDHLLVHAILHLLGYSHGKSSEAKKMQTKEKEILAAIDH